LAAASRFHLLDFDADVGLLGFHLLLVCDLPGETTHVPALPRLNDLLNMVLNLLHEILLVTLSVGCLWDISTDIQTLQLVFDGFPSSRLQLHILRMVGSTRDLMPLEHLFKDLHQNLVFRIILLLNRLRSWQVPVCVEAVFLVVTDFNGHTGGVRWASCADFAALFLIFCTTTSSLVFKPCMLQRRLRQLVRLVAEGAQSHVDGDLIFRLVQCFVLVDHLAELHSRVVLEFVAQVIVTR